MTRTDSSEHVRGEYVTMGAGRESETGRPSPPPGGPQPRRQAGGRGGLRPAGESGASSFSACSDPQRL
eukprot:8612950-Alexandrium_andersonii.AAC.1